MDLRGARRFLLPTAAAAVAAATTGDLGAQTCDRPCVGPDHGAIIVAGGGNLNESIYEEFVRLAGGPDARIVLIPTAGAMDGSHDGWTAIEELKRVGVRSLDILHTRSRLVADLAAFTAPLREATGVWLSGGRSARLVEVYLDTHTQQELARVLDRGGVIGGNSAGASALASFLLRGGEDNAHVIAPNHVDGFGFLREVAIDQHLVSRARENDLFAVLDIHPHLLGIGLEDGAALLITGDLARVMGAHVAIYDVTDPLTLIPLRWLVPGEVYDLGARRTVLEDIAPPLVADPFDQPFDEPGMLFDGLDPQGR